MQPTPDVIAAAQAAARKWGVPASVTLAQWADESAWGKDVPEGSDNPFGIKAAPGQPFVTAATTEVEGGKVVHVEARFRKFASIDAAFDAHGELLATDPRYRPAMAEAASPEAFARMLTGRYATDPAYGGKLIAIMNGSNLYRFDVTSAPASAA
jgi:flagellum-specific peptidoglycan hydrolase FlgJ